MKKPRVLIGYSRCEATRHAFELAGCDAWTCDVLPVAYATEKHIQGDIWDVVEDDWDLGVFHPMCTYLTISAAWAFKDPDYTKYPSIGYHQKIKEGTLTGVARRNARDMALKNFLKLDNLPYPTVIENPAPSFISSMYRKPNQIIQPYHFEEDASKGTGLWIKDMPLLQPTGYYPPRIVNGKPRWGNQTDSGQNKLTPTEDRWLERSKTYPGIAKALGAQYGKYLLTKGDPLR